MTEFNNYWDKVAQKGQYQMGPQIHRIYLLNLLKKLGVKSFLDVGCGTGPLYELLINAPLRDYLPISEYKGVDYSEEMIRVCKKEFPKGNFEVQDARKLLEVDNSWDAVVLMHCLDHLDKYQEAIQEAARVTRQYVIIILWRALTGNDNNLNSHNSLERIEGEWSDTHLQEYSIVNLLNAFAYADLRLELEYAGEEINQGNSQNRLFVLKKI